jgi:hypothetical protein
MNEAERKALFSVNRMAEGFLSTLLQDLQHREADDACMEGRAERDVGTIYDCPDETLADVLRECDAFREAMLRDPIVRDLLDDGYAMHPIGSDLYLERAGHGAGFRDRDIWSRAQGERLSDLVSSRASLDAYLGDDGKAYIG